MVGRERLNRFLLVITPSIARTLLLFLTAPDGGSVSLRAFLCYLHFGYSVTIPWLASNLNVVVILGSNEYITEGGTSE